MEIGQILERCEKYSDDFHQVFMAVQCFAEEPHDIVFVIAGAAAVFFHNNSYFTRLRKKEQGLCR